MPCRDIRYQAAIVRGHHTLLVKVYDRTDGRQFWILPGGGREPDEDAEACLRREVREETGLKVAPQRLLFVTPDIPEGGYEWLHTYLCLVVAGEAQPGIDPDDDHDGLATIRALAWFDLRAPARWDPELAAAKITLPLLHQLRSVLGYTEDERNALGLQHPLLEGRFGLTHTGAVDQDDRGRVAHHVAPYRLATHETHAWSRHHTRSRPTSNSCATLSGRCLTVHGQEQSWPLLRLMPQ